MVGNYSLGNMNTELTGCGKIKMNGVHQEVNRISHH